MAVLNAIHLHNGAFDGNGRQKIVGEMCVSRDMVEVSGSNLVKLELLAESLVRDPTFTINSPLGIYACHLKLKGGLA